MIGLKRLFLALIGIMIMTLAIFFFRTQEGSALDFPARVITQSSPEVVIDIPAGASGSEIAALLFKFNVVKSAEAYFKVAVSDKSSERVAPGQHRLSLQISASQALDQLLDSSRIPNLVKVSEGAWKVEIQDSLVAFGFIESDVEKAFSSVALPNGFNNVEGILFPAQYTFAKSATALSAVQSMVDRFLADDSALQLLQGSAEFTALELLTIASIIQVEGDNKDFKKVSRVIRNRLKLGMPLQMDSTVHFIKKNRGEIFLSTQSTLINSAYNTYRNTGLPPGPIGSPGTRAIDAALNPDEGDWLYFITVAPGDTRFTAAYDEFLQWKRLYTKNRKAGVFQ